MTTVAASAECTGCRGPLPDDASFCPMCGVAVVEPDLLLDPLGADSAKVELDHRSQDRVPTSRSDWRVIAVVGAAAMVLAAWFVIRTPRTTLDGVADALTGSASDQSADSRFDATSWPDEIDFVTVELGTSDGSPPLDEPLAMDLFLALPSNVIKVALDTGEVETFNVDGELIAVWEDELLLKTLDSFVAVPLMNPEGPSRPLYEGPTGGSSEISDLVVVDDQLVATYYPTGTEPSQAVDVIDLKTGAIRSVPVTEPGFAQHGLVWVPGGGTFDVAGDQPDKVFDGLAFASGPTVGIGLSCVGPDECENIMFDRRTGERRTDLTLPEVDQPWSVRFLSGSERFVMLAEPQGTVSGAHRARFFDVVAGAYLPSGMLPPGRQTYEFEEIAHFAVGGDRYLARASNGSVRIQDAIDHRGWKLELPELDVVMPAQANRVFFVER